MADFQDKSFVIDVREPEEFRSERVPGSINVPLSSFSQGAPGALPWSKAHEVIFMCRSGQRARLAATEAQRMGLLSQEKCKVYPGGIIAWRKEGRSVEPRSKVRAPMPILRQVQLIVGLVVLVSSVGVLMGVDELAYLSAFFGAGLTIAGVTGFCGLGVLLSRLPWNSSASVCSVPNSEVKS